MSTNTYFTVCPHCGYQSEDDEMCQACGVLFDGSPDGDVSIEAILEGMKASAKGIVDHFQKSPRHKFEEDLDFDPSWSVLPSNVFNVDES